MKSIRCLSISCKPLLPIIFSLLSSYCFSQAEVEAWGNISGVRIDGQLVRFQSSLAVVNADWSKISATALERQKPKYHRENNTQIITTRIDSLYFMEQVQDIGTGKVKVIIQYRSGKDTMLAGLFFVVKIPARDFGDSVQQQSASGIAFAGDKNQLSIDYAQNTNAIIKRTSEKGVDYLNIYIPLVNGAVKKDQTGERSFVLQASGTVDRDPVTVEINKYYKGPAFAGFGGNFRLQNPKLDPVVIDYCLSHIRVAWGRVEMPWQLWQPVLSSDPVALAKAGNLNEHVKHSMEMAQKLSKMGIPVILTAWSAPRWAVQGDIGYGPRANGVWGNPLDTVNPQAIYKSIADYIQYLKDAYGVEIKLFSFNESDLGINIRQTGEEHAKLIKGLGSYLEKRGLKTKMLLGDNSDATTYTFIYPAMKDTSLKKYIGAISFHSWRGWETELLQKWADAAKIMNLPLIIGEGSIDAAAWAYPQVFEEQKYAIEEINLYIRLLDICQPLSILQWQLTTDYSLLSGGQIFGDNGPLRPTQRFWNMKQLSSIPPNVSAIPVTVDRPFISCAAEAGEKGVYIVHLVNNGASRIVTVKGISANQVVLHVTSKTKSMEISKPIPVKNGTVSFNMDAVSYTTVVSE